MIEKLLRNGHLFKTTKNGYVFFAMIESYDQFHWNFYDENASNQYLKKSILIRMLKLRIWNSFSSQKFLLKASKIFFKSLLLEWKRYQNNFQEHDFLRDLKIPPFFPCHVAAEKRAGISEHVKNVLFKVVLLSFSL